MVPAPRIFYTRAISINASPEEIYPRIAQLGADKGGMYSYTWLEALIQCPQTNADRIHEEWQGLEVGDKVLMCPDENMPPAYVVALVEQDHTIVMGHKSPQLPKCKVEYLSCYFGFSLKQCETNIVQPHCLFRQLIIPANAGSPGPFLERYLHSQRLGDHQ